ncbi:MAG: hypothetical protein GYB66_11745, partial [Chloroflexi bacterium]|nr:hypothetical protein [Chloroflexota bacterium]
MHLTGLLDALSSTAMFQSLVERLKHQSRLPDQAIVRSARPFMVAAVVRALADIPILVVTARVDRAHNVAEQILAWLPDANVLRFQEPTTMFYEHAPWTDTTIQARIQTLAALAPPIRSRTAPEPPGTGSPVVISSAYALMQRTLPARQFRTASRHLRVGQQGDPEKLLQHWVAVGYQPASVVTGPGTFSRRGGIIDIYPPAMALPVRIEFFGDEIDSLRTFDPATQRSVAALDGFVVTPAREALPKNMSSLAERLATWFQSQPAPETDVTSTLDDYGHLESGMAFPHAEFYLPMLYQQPASLLDYLPQEALIIIEDWAALRDTVAELEVQALERREDLIPDNVIPPTMRLPYHTWDDLYESLTSRTPLHLGHPEHLIAPEEIEDDQLGFAPGPRFGGQLRLFMDHLEKLVPTADQAIVVTRQAQRLAELWSERHQQATYPLTKIDTLAELPPVTFVEGELTEGWVLEIDERSRLHLLTDAEIFGWKRPEPRRRTQQRRVNPEAYYADLEEGAYVVHVDYGIGRFQGVHKRRLQDSEREYLLVEYAGNDILYVPIHQADRLSRYVGV